MGDSPARLPRSRRDPGGAAGRYLRQRGFVRGPRRSPGRRHRGSPRVRRPRPRRSSAARRGPPPTTPPSRGGEGSAWLHSSRPGGPLQHHHARARPSTGSASRSSSHSAMVDVAQRVVHDGRGTQPIAKSLVVDPSLVTNASLNRAPVGVWDQSPPPTRSSPRGQRGLMTPRRRPCGGASSERRRR